MNMLQKLAQQLGQAQQGLQQGDGKKAADAMDQMAQELGQMQKDMEELKMLNAAMDQVEMAKDAMVCKNCNGEGCEQCQGNKFGNNDGSVQAWQTGQRIGQGRRHRPASGTKGRHEHPRNASQAKAQARATQCLAAWSMGPNIKGDVAQSIKEEMATHGAEPADPLTNDRLPKSRQEQAEQYFHDLREGK